MNVIGAPLATTVFLLISTLKVNAARSTHNRTHDSTDDAIEAALVVVALVVAGACSVGEQDLKASVGTALIMAVEDDISPPLDSVHIRK